jgi:hypothetical protein
MKAHDINTIDTRATGRAWHRSLALAITVCSLVAPSIASANDDGGASPRSPNERTPTELGQTTGKFREKVLSRQVGGNDSSATRTGDASQSDGAAPAADADQVRIRDGSAAVPFVPWPNGAPPAEADGGFEWASAAIGAAAAMGLVALGGALFLTLRRRTAMSPSASTS